MSFKFSARSLKLLKPVHPDLVRVANRALELSQLVDFGITCGARTLQEQEKLFLSGASRTMKSKHLIQPDGYSHAIDILAYVDGKGTYVFKHYEYLAERFMDAAEELGVAITWGAVWDKRLNDIGDVKKEVLDYSKRQKKKTGKPALIDGVHFELS